MTCGDPAEVIAPPEQVRRLQRRLARETAARKEAERLLEQKSLELFALNRSLMQLNNHLEQRVEHRTRELMQERLQAQEQAYRDPLTGLANRPMFRRHLRQAVRRTGCLSHAAVLYLDLSGFKTVNDTLGHPVGDALLCAAAARLRQRCRSSCCGPSRRRFPSSRTASP
jgi:GGDEF domain-containing protein